MASSFKKVKATPKGENNILTPEELMQIPFLEYRENLIFAEGLHINEANEKYASKSFGWILSLDSFYTYLDEEHHYFRMCDMDRDSEAIKNLSLGALCSIYKDKEDIPADIFSKIETTKTLIEGKNIIKLCLGLPEDQYDNETIQKLAKYYILCDIKPNNKPASKIKQEHE